MAAISWRAAALMIGEKLGNSGPEGYYMMSATDWYMWMMQQLKEKKHE